MPYKVNPTTGQLDYYEVSEGGGGGVATNLSFIPSPSSGTVTSDSGTDADIPLADSTNSGLLSPAEKTKLAGIAAGAEVNVNADWNATTGDALILNKPTSLPSSFVKHAVKYGEALVKGQAAYVSSSNGTNMIVSKADYSLESTSSKTMGLIITSGATNFQGEILTEGLLSGTGSEPLSTISANAGDPVWLGDDGNLLYGLANKPIAPNHMVFIGIVTRVHAVNGEIFVKVQNGYELNELHDVSLPSYVSNGVLYRDTTLNLWKIATIQVLLGFNPVNPSIIGASNGVAPLNSSSKIDQTYLPSYVDDVLEYDNTGLFPTIGETGKIYVSTNTNITYRWSGSGYVEISSSLALGETSATAYRGDRGASAYAHSLLTSGNPHNVTKAEVGLGNVPNTDATNPANIVQTSSYRFVTDAEKATWNAVGSVIPDLKGNEVFRGVTFRNNSTTIDTLGGITNSLTGTQGANSVATTNYRTRQVSIRFEPSVVSTGNYCCMRCSTALWSITGGFLFNADFGIADAGYAVGTHNFWGLTDSVSALAIGGTLNSQPSALLNIIAVANDSGDANLQFMHNDGTGTATKIDLGANFPSNRTSGAVATAMYNIKIYNPAGSSTVYYKVTNKETGAVAEGSVNTNLPSTSTLLSYQGGRSMGTSGGGVSQSGRFDVSILGVYNI